MVPRVSAPWVVITPEMEQCNITNTSSYLVWLFQLANACAEEEYVHTMLFQSVLHPFQSACCFVLPKRSLWIMLPTQICMGLYLWEKQSSDYLHRDLHFNKSDPFLSFFIDGCKQECYQIVHQNTHSVQTCMIFLVRSFTLVQGCSCTTVEVIGCQALSLLQGLLCRWRPSMGGFFFPASEQCVH